MIFFCVKTHILEYFIMKSIYKTIYPPTTNYINFHQSFMQRGWSAGSALDGRTETSKRDVQAIEGPLCDPRKAGKARRGGYSFIGEKK